jgi:hypothetical protein
MTLSGLTLGAPQPAGVFFLSSAAELGSQQKAAPAIIGLSFISCNVTTSAASITDQRSLLSFRISFKIPQSYVPGSSSLLERFSLQASNSSDGVEVAVSIGGTSWSAYSTFAAAVPALTPQASLAALDELLTENRRGNSAICSLLMRSLIEIGQVFSSFECVRPLSIDLAVV